MQIKSLNISHKGKRNVNQDYILTEMVSPDTYLFLVTDGIGGYEHGDLAAKIVAENILAYLSTVENIDYDHLQMAVNKSNRAIKQLKDKYNSKMGAAVGCLVIQRNLVSFFGVGDVKLFKYHRGLLSYESTPQTLINEIAKNSSVSNFKTLEKYKHIVTSSVQGDVKSAKLDYTQLGEMSIDDIYILCSDGVHDVLNGATIQQLLRMSKDINDIASHLEERLYSDASDNFSYVVIGGF